MKKKIALLSFVIVSGIYSAFACGDSECGGGTVKCCTDQYGKVFMCKGTGE